MTAPVIIGDDALIARLRSYCEAVTDSAADRIKSLAAENVSLRETLHAMLLEDAAGARAKLEQTAGDTSK